MLIHKHIVPPTRKVASQIFLLNASQNLWVVMLVFCLRDKKGRQVRKSLGLYDLCPGAELVSGMLGGYQLLMGSGGTLGRDG